MGTITVGYVHLCGNTFGERSVETIEEALGYAQALRGKIRKDLPIVINRPSEACCCSNGLTDDERDQIDDADIGLVF